jgi:hypothetical protein
MALHLEVKWLILFQNVLRGMETSTKTESFDGSRQVASDGPHGLQGGQYWLWRRQQELHRRVDEVADARHKNARYERLRQQQQDAGANREILSDEANHVRSEI